VSRSSSTDGTFAFVNQQMEEVSGYSSDELLGREVEDLVPIDLCGDHRRHRARFLGLGYTPSPFTERASRRLCSSSDRRNRG
jgi:PAS domain S-box-containing protein